MARSYPFRAASSRGRRPALRRNRDHARHIRVSRESESAPRAPAPRRTFEKEPSPIMKIPNDVIEDLLPLYLEGELSAASRQLVEEYLAENPERAASLSAAEAVQLPKVEAPPDIEMKSLDRTTRLLEQKSVA